MNVLLTAKQRGSTNALAPVARELIQRKNNITIYATGNEQEAAGFQGLPYTSLNPVLSDYERLVTGYDALVVGLSGSETHDGYFVKAANRVGIPSIAVQTQNSDWGGKLGLKASNFPTYIAVMDDECAKTAQEELARDLGQLAADRCVVVGWVALDHLATLRDSYSPNDRTTLLYSLGISLDKSVNLHLTQTTHPHSAYMKRVDRSYEQKVKDFLYEQGVVQFTFEAASDLGLKLVVKPHPGEEPQPGDGLYNYTRELCSRHDFIYISAKACNTQQLILAANSLTAGRSTALTEATLLNRNVGSIIPTIDEEAIKAFPPLSLGAIPFTQTWDGIKDVLQQVTSEDQLVLEKLAEDRRKFSVDGKAASRLVDLIETVTR